MLRKIKQAVAVVLTAALSMTMFTIAPNAAEISEPNTAINTADYAVSGNDSFGNMIADEITAEQKTTSQFSEGNSISDITITGNTAKVEYRARENCTILVALYNEKTGQMLASGKSTANAENGEVEVSIETNKMPEYFLTKVYMLNEYNEPMTDCYVEELYTESVQQVIALKATDFDEERVLNLDNDQSTNFAVYKDDTLVISKSTYNVLKSADEESGKYVFTNCNEELKSLASGDVFSYKYDSGKTLIVKVKDISVSGSTVTVTDEGDADLEDVFDYVKIESSQSLAGVKADTSSSSNGVTMETGEESVSSSDDKSVESVGVSYEGGMSDTLKFTIDLGKKDNSNNNNNNNDNNNNNTHIVDASISGSINIALSISVGVDVYINNKVWEYKTHYIDFSIDYGASVTFNVQAETKKTLEKVLATIPFKPVTGVNVELKPKFKFSVSAEVSVGATVEGKFGFNASFAHGVQNTSKAPEFEFPKFNYEGEIFLGFDLNPSMNFITPGLAETKLDMTLGATVSAARTEDEDDDHRVHRCTVCLSGYIGPTFSIEVSAEILGKAAGSYKKTFEIVKIPFYFSVNHLEFGLGECPYYTSYKCGDNAKWRLDDDGTLVIYGEGKMYDFDTGNAPWLDFRDEIEKVVIEDGITSIGNSAFGYNDIYYYSNLKEVTIPDSVTRIGNQAFFYCINLTNLTIPDSVTEIGNRAFSYCRSLTSIRIPCNVTKVDEYTFSYCTNLTSVTIPDGVTEIGDATFDSCYNIVELRIPDSVTYIGNRAFEACRALEEVNIPDGITRIGGETFRNCFSLTNIRIPDSVTYIGDGAFNDCEKLEGVSIPVGVTYIGHRAFEDCDGLTSISIPNNVTELGAYAFTRCDNLSRVSIPYGITQIKENTFSDCTSLTSIEIPDTVTVIGDNAFNGCKSLKNITVPDYVKELGRYAFAQSGIESITISSGVSELMGGTFQNCTALKKIYFKGDCPKIGRFAFYKVYATLYYPSGNATYKDFDPNSDNCKIKLAPYDYSSSVSAAAPQSTAVKANASAKANTPDTSDIVNVKANYYNKIAGFEYIISVVKDEKAEDVLSSANLIYMTQVKADKNGRISVSLPIGSDITDYKIMIFGPEKGDMYKDGGIDVLDVTKLQQYLAGDNDISYIPVEVADIDNDGKVTVNDVTMLQLYLAKKISTLS